MNKFQAMAKIMAVIREDGLLKPGTREYKIARKWASCKIDDLGPKAAWEQAKKSRNQILDRIRIETMEDEIKKNYPYLEF
jgi:hypothetical protein